MGKKPRSALPLMALTVLIDFTGFGLVIPLLPFLAQRLGANPVGVGLIVTIYALAQFIFTPILGALSDRYGRRPIILWSLLIETISMVLTALSGSFIILLCARFIGGLGASNIGSAQAVVSDVTSIQDRAKGMGIIGASIGLGFVLGPALGGILTLGSLPPTLPFWVAASLALINASLVFFFLPETRNLRAKGAQTRKSVNRFTTLFTSFQHARHLPIVVRLIFVNLLFLIAFTSMETIFPLFSQKNFGWGATQNAYIFTYVGFIVVLMQGGLVGRLVKRWNEQTVMLGGLVCLALGLLILAFSNQLALLLIGIGILSIGDGAISPTISTLLSFASPVDAQGETLGLAQGFGGLARVIGPLIAGGLDVLSGPGIPLVAGGILVVLAALIVFPVLSKIQRPESKLEASEVMVAGK